VTRPAGDNRLAVSLPPSTGKLFDAIGVTSAIERAGFIRSTGNTVWWGSAEPRLEPFASGSRGWQVEMARLAEILLESAADAGVHIQRGMADGDQAGALFVLDCTGRAGVLARGRDLRVYQEGPRTIALSGEWRTGRAWSVPDDTHTIVESYGDGWMWSVPVAPGVRHVAAMIDPERSDLARGGPAADVHRAEIAKTREFKRLLADAVLQDGPWGFDASTYGARSYAGDGWLLVGDAGSFIDPLSSAGVKKALASGWLAAVVTHTCLINPAMRGHALAFYESRERDIAQHHAAESRAFLREAARGHHQAFWAGRSADPDETPAESGGVRHLHGIDVLTVLELAPEQTQVPDLYETYVRRVSPVALHDFLLALSTAIARGMVVSE
jgi:flavin-dependent dehydrogenase